MRRTLTKVELPVDFAQQILNAEIEYRLSDRPSMTNVKTLIQLYSQGVEYYESIRSYKYLYFQQKMADIFQTKSALSSIEGTELISDCDSPLKRKMKSNVQEQKIEAIKFKQKQVKLQKEVIEQTRSAAAAQTAKKIINERNLKNVSNAQKVKRQMQSQEQKLQQKLQRRRSKINLSKSMTCTDLSIDNETRQSIFVENQQFPQDIGCVLKPLQVSFSNIIQEDQSSEEDEIILKKRRMSIINSAQDKKAKSLLDLFEKPEHNVAEHSESKIGLRGPDRDKVANTANDLSQS